MLGCVGLFDAQLFDQLARGEWPVAEQFHYGNASGVSQSLEYLCFESTEGIRH
jgi:hypothetical protein